MKAFIDIDVQEHLRRVVEENTRYYKTDFEYDIAALKNAAFRPHGRNFLWLSRESGTYLFDECDVFITNAPANHTWLYYRDHPEEIRAFWVQVESIRDGKPRGSLVALDYAEHCQWVDEYARPADRVNLTFNDGYRRTFGVNEFAENKQAIRDRYGSWHEVEYDSDDITTLMINLRGRYTSDLEQYDFEQYLRDIRLEQFVRFGHHRGDHIRIGNFDARMCLEAGVDVFVFEKGAPRRQLRHKDEVDRLPYRSSILGIREVDKPLLEYIKPENQSAAPLFQPEELRVLYTCAAFGGTTLDWNADENNTLQSLLNKLHVLQKASRGQDISNAEYPVLDVAQDMEPEP